MESIEVVKILSAYGVGGILAAFIFHYHTKSEQDNKARMSEIIKENRESLIQIIKEKNESQNLLIAVIKENSTVIARHTTVSESLHRRLDSELSHHRENDRTKDGGI